MLLLINSMIKISVTACFVFPPQLILTYPAEEHQQGFIGTVVRQGFIGTTRMVLPCVACTEDENCTRAVVMGNREAEQLFPSEAEQQQQHQGPVQGRKSIISITCTHSSFQRFQRRKHKDALKWRLQTPRELLLASDLDSP